jgi:hypothetical protein
MWGLALPGTGRVLPRLRLGLRANDAGLWQDRWLVPPPQRHRAAGLRRPDRPDRFGLSRIPSGFIPMQDKGYLVTNIQLTDSTSLERSLDVTDAVEKIAECPHALPAGDVVHPQRQQL